MVWCRAGVLNPGAVGTEVSLPRPGFRPIMRRGKRLKVLFLRSAGVERMNYDLEFVPGEKSSPVLLRVT